MAINGLRVIGAHDMGLFQRFSALAAATLLLAACQTPASYQPRAGENGTGYSDQQLAANRFRVTFTGNSATKRETVENYLLRRAAEVTRDAGFAWFVFDNRDTAAETTWHSDVPAWPGYGWYHHRWPGWGMGGDVTTRPQTSYEAYAEIVLLTDEQAKTEPRAMRADDVLRRLPPVPAPAKP
jgi:hypothetical protein